MKPNVDLATLPPAVLVILGAVLLAEAVLDVVALVSLVRRPKERVAFGNKWVWVAIIVLVNLIGPILYFAVGRLRSVPAEEPAAAPPGRVTMAEVADALYGERDREGA
ncbi:PLD nuclease N-terminal domain-containing protein [Leifsonia sp. NPDC102414]|uniref:PLD nuclease N-terminal domain-containing protein n=1 Tax=Leifsonia sp. NPDC102414 TaxID=3364124 RepID=UPI00380D65F6